MTVRTLDGAEVGLPPFDPGDRQDGSLFDLSSHSRAREALETGLAMKDAGFNVFVLGEDRSGRMTETLEFLARALEDKPVPDDWVYLNNFRRSHRPKPVHLPPGVGREFRDAMARAVPGLRDALTQAFGGAEFQESVDRAGDRVREQVNADLETLRKDALEHRMTIIQTAQGMMIAALGEDDKPVGIETLPEDRRQEAQELAQDLGARLADIMRRAAELQSELADDVTQMRRQAADHAVGVILEPLIAKFGKYPGLNRWLIGMREDVLDNLLLFQGQEAAPAMPGMPREQREPPERRYTVNLLVDHGDETLCTPYLESNPTYENLFGRIEYRSTGGYLDTDFSLIRAGALHKANGGILVLRAESIGSHPMTWNFLKGALRDGMIAIQETHRHSGVQLTGAPDPKPIPLDVKVVIVGAPRWYYAFFSIDPEFRAHFKVKADIDPDMEATPENLSVLAGVIRESARRLGPGGIEDAAVARLLSHCSRWAGDRSRLTAQVETLQDLLAEAGHLTEGDGRHIALTDIDRAIGNRRRRNSRIEDRSQEQIADGAVLIATEGAVVGQVNGLTVRDVGDHAFGGASRITARASIGRLGVINIERQVAMSGPIQQKGAMVLQGYLTGVFARAAPVSFNCSITFEQNYGGVEGDSASLAELVAILSDLSGLPVRQDLAITGSVNQRGAAQVIGGAHHKIEGFFRTCRDRGLTGTQGAIVPRANERHLVLRPEVAAAVENGEFHLYSVETVEDAVELFLGHPAGEADADGIFPPASIYGRVQATLARFDAVLSKRASEPDLAPV